MEKRVSITIDFEDKEICFFNEGESVLKLSTPSGFLPSWTVEMERKGFLALFDEPT